MKLKRRFLAVGDRRVHYFRAGDGPPVVLIHSSPASARLMMKEIARLSGDYTVFAFDTPGFGLSDPLPMAELEVADLADAMAATLAAIGMPPCPIFGTHTGAAIALELGARHPQVATGMVLDGVPAFTDEECERFFADYFRTLPLSDLGGHYSEAWSRFRDQSLWFPWSARTPDHLNRYDLSPPHSTQLWVSMYFEAAEHYIPAYRAASYYGSRALTAAAKLTVPTVYTAAHTDMLYAHLERLPPLKANQRIADIGDSFQRKRDLIAEAFAEFGSPGAAPADRDSIGSSEAISRQFVDGRSGQLHLRFAGQETSPPLLLIHDAPGSAEQSEPLIASLAERFFVIAPDLPGNGESDAHPVPPSVDDYALDGMALLDQLGIDRAFVYGVGFGSSVALAIAATHDARVIAVAIQGLALPDPAERADLVAHYAPPIDIEADGAHWYRTWLMLRDSQVYWPWYDRTLGAQRRVAADFSARPLHRWTMDVMRARATYGALIAAALADDSAARLDRLAVPLALIRETTTPLSHFDDRLEALAPAARLLSPGADLACSLLELGETGHGR